MRKALSATGTVLTRRQALGSLAAAGFGVVSMLGEGVGLAQNTRFTRLPKWKEPRFKGYKNLSGNNVYYEEYGQEKGIPVVLTSASIYDAESTRGTAEKLDGNKYRVIAWDRANCGYSDFVLKGARDNDVWSDQLAELLLSLNAAPAYLAACSMGMRTSVQTAVRYPDLVRGLILWDITGSHLNKSLSQQYFGQYADAAEKYGTMDAVVKMPVIARLIKLNPRNRERLLGIDPKEFVRVYRRWQKAYDASDPVLGVSEADCRKLNASGIPTRIIAGCDPAHPRSASDALAKLIPSAEYLTPPGFCEEVVKITNEAREWAKTHNEDTLLPYFETSSLPRLIDEFVTKTETNGRS